MVNDCLSAMQETLDTYNIRHDRWDYESELGWEGSNDRVMQVLKQSPYFVAPTPERGGYLDLAQFIKDANLPTGKKVYFSSCIYVLTFTGLSERLPAAVYPAP